MKGYKGFDKDFKCRDFQFKVGGNYKHTGDVKICSSGFHFCKNPLDVFKYYCPGTSRFAEVEGDGTIKNNDGEDSKVACSELHIKAEASMSGLIGAGVKFIMDKIDWKDPKQTTTGDGANAATTGYGANAATTGYGASAATTGYGASAATTGYGANAATTGDRASAATTGDRASAATTGKNSIAAAIGINGAAKGALGCFIVVADWRYNKKKSEWQPRGIKSLKVDGKKIKANTFYTIENGKLKIQKETK